MIPSHSYSNTITSHHTPCFHYTTSSDSITLHLITQGRVMECDEILVVVYLSYTPLLRLASPKVPCVLHLPTCHSCCSPISRLRGRVNFSRYSPSHLVGVAQAVPDGPFVLPVLVRGYSPLCRDLAVLVVEISDGEIDGQLLLLLATKLPARACARGKPGGGRDVAHAGRRGGRSCPA